MSQFDDLIARKLPDRTKMMFCTPDNRNIVVERLTLETVPQGNVVGAKFWSLFQANHPGNTPGYWLFTSDQTSNCWTATNGGNGQIAYWNQDGKASWPPENDEMFYFEAVDPTAQTVRIRQTYGSYVVANGRGLFAGQTQADATVLFVSFRP